MLNLKTIPPEGASFVCTEHTIYSVTEYICFWSCLIVCLDYSLFNAYSNLIDNDLDYVLIRTEWLYVNRLTDGLVMGVLQIFKMIIMFS